MELKLKLFCISDLRIQCIKNIAGPQPASVDIDSDCTVHCAGSRTEP